MLIIWPESTKRWTQWPCWSCCKLRAIASSTMVSSSASGGMSSIGGKPSAPASRASSGEGFPLFTFSAVSRTIDSDCRSNRERRNYITTAFFSFFWKHAIYCSTFKYWCVYFFQFDWCCFTQQWFTGYHFNLNVKFPEFYLTFTDKKLHFHDL